MTDDIIMTIIKCSSIYIGAMMGFKTYDWIEYYTDEFKPRYRKYELWKKSINEKSSLLSYYRDKERHAKYLEERFKERDLRIKRMIDKNGFKELPVDFFLKIILKNSK